MEVPLSVIGKWRSDFQVTERLFLESCCEPPCDFNIPSWLYRNEKIKTFVKRCCNSMLDVKSRVFTLLSVRLFVDLFVLC